MHKGYRFLLGALGVLLSFQVGLVGANEEFTPPAPAARRGTVLVVPRRPTLVQIGFDVIYLRPAVMVCYETGLGLDVPAVSVWDTTTSAWRRMSLAHYQSGNFLAFSPKRAIIVGTEAELPASIGAGATWAGETVRIANLSMDDVFNALNQTLHFSGREWEWLAKRYGLQIRDLNVERRRYGRYGPPGGRPAEPLIKVTPESRIMPPLPREETPAPVPEATPDPKPNSVEDEVLNSITRPAPVEEVIGK